MNKVVNTLFTIGFFLQKKYFFFADVWTNVVVSYHKTYDTGFMRKQAQLDHTYEQHSNGKDAHSVKDDA